MTRVAKRSVLVVFLALVAVTVTPALSTGQGGTSALLPPNAKFQGRSMAEWSILASQYLIATGLGGQELPDTIGHVRFLPTQLGSGAAEFSVELDPGTAFAVPAFFLFGERYADGSQDEATDEVAEFFFGTTFIETRLNGTVLLQGFASELQGYQFGPVDFYEPIVYTEPQPRGDGVPDAVAAIVVLGVGSVYRPLPVGEHTLQITATSVFGPQEFTYHITVTPRGRR